MKKKLQSVMALLLLVGAVLTASAVKRPTEIHFRHLNGEDAFPNHIGSVFCHYDSVGHLDQLRFVCVSVMAGSAAQGELPKGDFDPIRYDTITANLAWHDNMVTVTGQSPYYHENFQFSYLLDNGRATQRNGGEYAQRFFYNTAGELSDIIYRYGREDQSITTFNRENGNVVNIHGQRSSFDPAWFGSIWHGGNSNAIMNYSYGTNANPAGIDFLLLETMPFNNMIMNLACIDGKHSSLLPSSRTYRKWINGNVTPPIYQDITQEYTYEFDADGYPVKISIPVYDSRTDVVELKYGNHPINVGTGGVAGIEADNALFTLNGRTVSVEESNEIRAYDMQGRLIVSGYGTLTLPEAGIYILRSGAKTMKAAVK